MRLGGAIRFRHAGGPAGPVRRRGGGRGFLDVGCFRFRRSGRAATQVRTSGLPIGDGHRGGACRITAPPATTAKAGEPPPSEVLRPGFPVAADLNFAPVARHLAVCGGDVATATENEGSSCRYVRYPKGAGPLRHGVSRRTPPWAWRPICFCRQLDGRRGKSLCPRCLVTGKCWSIWTEYSGSVSKWQQRPIISVCWPSL